MRAPMAESEPSWEQRRFDRFHQLLYEMSDEGRTPAKRVFEKVIEKLNKELPHPDPKHTQPHSKR
jgi:hypothetical protein